MAFLVKIALMDGSLIALLNAHGYRHMIGYRVVHMVLVTVGMMEDNIIVDAVVIGLVHLVHLVHLAHLVHLVHLVQPMHVRNVQNQHGQTVLG